MRRLALVALAALAALLLAGPGRDPEGATAISGRVTRVVDGDTMHVSTDGGRRYTVRLIGIDTPETKRPGSPVECGGPQASANLESLAAGRRVTLRTDPAQDTYDSYGRLLAYAWTGDGVSLQRRQLRDGWAEVYVHGGRPFRHVGAFRAAEHRARAARRGIWGAC